MSESDFVTYTEVLVDPASIVWVRWNVLQRCVHTKKDKQNLLLIIWNLYLLDQLVSRISHYNDEAMLTSFTVNLPIGSSTFKNQDL